MKAKRETKPFVAYANLLWRLQFTGQPTGLVRFHRIHPNRHRDNVVAPSALEVAYIETLGAGHNASQVHAVVAFRTAWSLDGQ
jgi:hypothetical protein